MRDASPEFDSAAVRVERPARGQSASELGARIVRAARAAAAIDLIERVRRTESGAASETPRDQTGG